MKRTRTAFGVAMLLLTLCISEGSTAFSPLGTLGIGLEKTDKVGRTPLHLAIDAGNIEEVKNLIKRGANLNAQSKITFARTPLETAINKDQYEIFLLLIQNGADINLVDKDGNALAIVAGRSDNMQYLSYLLDHGVSVNIQNPFHWGLLHQCSEGLDLVIYNQKFGAQEECIALLVAHGANVNEKAALGMPLHYAVFGGNIIGLKKLIELGANPELKNHENQTPLEEAISLNKNALNSSFAQHDAAQKKIARRQEIIEYLKTISKQ